MDTPISLPPSTTAHAPPLSTMTHTTTMLFNHAIIKNFITYESTKNQQPIHVPLQHTRFFMAMHTLTDAFEDAGDKGGGGSTEEKVHVRVQQRNGRKCITTVAGLADDLDIKRICKAFKKNFSCNGAVQNDLEVGEVIQLSGDQRVSYCCQCQFLKGYHMLDVLFSLHECGP